MLELPERPTLADYQRYVRKLETQRGFADQSVLEKCLLIGEELGELFKAVRCAQRIKLDPASRVGSVGEELADLLIYICAIANRFDLDLEEELRAKEEINKSRTWV